MKAANHTTFDVIARNLHTTALATVVALALVGAAAPDVQAREATATAGQDITGRSVMMNGDRIGTVVDTIKRGNTDNDVLIELDRQHYQMGVVLGSAGTNRMAGNDSPVIVGGKVIAVPMEAFSQGMDGDALRLSDKAVTTLNEFAPRK